MISVTVSVILVLVLEIWDLVIVYIKLAHFYGLQCVVHFKHVIICYQAKPEISVLCVA